MNMRDDILHRSSMRPAGLALAAFCALLATAALARAEAQDGNAHAASQPVGSWYLALDAEPFDPAFAGLVLSGIAHFHRDRTFMLSDAGDFAAQSFLGTLATPQYGVWARKGGLTLIGTSLSLEGDPETGEALGWTKVQFGLELVDDNRMEGTINAFFLPCDDALPIPTPLTCPDPIANADQFMPASPPDVPLTLTRMIAGQ